MRSIRPLNFLYQITNIKNGKSYIGQSASYTVKNRFARHLSTARTGRGYALHEAIRRHGEENFICQHIMTAFTKDDLEQLESILILQNKTLYPHGYNLTQGGKAGQKIGTPINFEGMDYISLAALIRSFGFEVTKVRQRVDRYGWTLRQALEIDKRPSQENPRAIQTVVKDKGEEKIFYTLTAACEFYGKKEGKIRGRIKKGETIEQALELVKRNIPKRIAYNGAPQIIDDQYFPTLQAACTFFNIRTDKFYDRKGRGWTIEQIFGVHSAPPRNHPLDKSFEVGGYIFTSLESASTFFGLHLHAVSTRLRAGWTHEEAAGLVARKRQYGKNPISISYKIDGKKFTSIKELADEYSIGYPLLRKRLRQLKWPLRQALGLEYRKSARK